MTEADYNAQIRTQEQNIGQLRSEITELEGKIEKLIAFQKEVQSMQVTLQDTVSSAVSQISGISPGVSSLVQTAIMLSNTFFSEMLSVIQGEDYTKAGQDLVDADAELTRTVTILNEQIAQKGTQISNCQYQISSLQNQKQTYLAEQERLRIQQEQSVQ